MRQEDHKFEASQGCNNGLLRASGTQASQETTVFHAGDLSPAGSSVGTEAFLPASAAWEKTQVF